MKSDFGNDAQHAHQRSKQALSLTFTRSQSGPEIPSNAPECSIESLFCAFDVRFSARLGVRRCCASSAKTICFTRKAYQTYCVPPPPDGRSESIAALKSEYGFAPTSFFVTFTEPFG